jgi:hypothetical protein
MDEMGIAIEDGMPVVLIDIPNDQHAYIAHRIVGVDKRTFDPVVIPLYRRVFTANGAPFMCFEACLN